MYLTVITLLLAVSNLSAATLYVSLASTNPTPPYATWATAATNIQDAVDAAAAGDEVVVTNGTYATGGRAVGTNASVNRVAVEKPLTLTSVNGPGVTVIRGHQAPNPIRCVYLTNGSSLSGFSLTNGATQGIEGDDVNGGGVWCESATAALSNCVLSGNSASSRGGGAYGGTLNNCVVSGNSASDSGGGAYGGPLNNCTLTGNSATYGGGAFGSALNNCTLTRNSAPFGGGAEGCTLYNCMVTGNSASDSGGGAGGCTLYNCAVTGNRGHYSGGADGCTLYNCTVTGNGSSWFAGVSDCTLYNCIVYFNTSGLFTGGEEDDVASCTLNYCCTPAVIGGAGNITNAPLFVDYAAGNLRLQPDSPCIDAGDNDYAPGPVDLDGNPRIVNGTVDIGACEFQGPTNGPPLLRRQPASLTSDVGTTVSFSVAAGGSEPLSFQWLMDGLPLADGGNRAGTGTGVLTLTNVVSADAGGYSVVVSNQYGTATSSVALLTVNLATLDGGFNPGAYTNSDAYSLALQPDGKILVGGFFMTLGGQSCSCIARFNADGTVDTAFNSAASTEAYALALQANGKIVVGGFFTTLGGQSRSYLGRLNADGTVDSSFNPGANSTVLSLALQADGKILVGGAFGTLGGQSRNSIGRLNADGTLDTSFDPGAGGGIYGVCSLAVQPDGKILVGGEFTTLTGQARQCLGRLNNSEPATQSLNYDGSAITWLRGGASPEVWRTTFDFSTNGSDWASLGAGARTAGGWQLASVSPPSANGTIRAQGYVADGCSAWFVETDLAVSPPPVILVNDPSFGFNYNRFGFKLSGSAGQVVIVEASANLISWTPVATNSLGATPVYFSEPYSGNLPKRFYRLRSTAP
jgi:uncharacterized delta-60 repeat protein